jgi:hypothetical protein
MPFAGFFPQMQIELLADLRGWSLLAQSKLVLTTLSFRL